MRTRASAKISTPDLATPLPPGPDQPFQVPPLQRARLKNDVEIALLQMERFGLVGLQLIVPSAGSSSDPHDKPGLAAVAAGLLEEGCGPMNSKEFAERMAATGARDFQVGASHDALTVSVLLTKDRFAEVLGLIATMVRFPKLPARELTQLKAQTVARLKQEKSIPGDAAEKRLNQEIFAGDPYGLRPTEASIGSITRNDVKRFVEASLGPRGATLAVGGDVTMSEIRAAARNTLEQWKDSRKTPAPAGFAALSDRSLAQDDDGAKNVIIDIIDMPGSPQSAIRAGHLTVRRTDPDYIPAAVMNFILGMMPFNNRLEQNIRERHRWAYGANSKIQALKRASFLIVETDVQTDATASAVREILAEMSRLRSERVPGPELEAAKRLMAGIFVLRQQTVQSLAAQASAIELYGLPADTLIAYRDNVRSVSADDILAAARTHLHPQRIRIVISGDAAKIQESFDSLRSADPDALRVELRVFDIDGSLKPPHPTLSPSGGGGILLPHNSSSSKS